MHAHICINTQTFSLSLFVCLSVRLSVRLYVCLPPLSLCEVIRDDDGLGVTRNGRTRDPLAKVLDVPLGQSSRFQEFGVREPR